MAYNRSPFCSYRSIAVVLRRSSFSLRNGSDGYISSRETCCRYPIDHAFQSTANHGFQTFLIDAITGLHPTILNNNQK